MKLINDKTDKSDPDSLGSLLDNPDSYALYEKIITAKQYHIYLHTEIPGSDKYVELFHKLRDANKGDHFYFYLNNAGGSVSTGIQLKHAIDDTEAMVTMVVDAPVYSMAALLALVGHEIIIKPNASFMFHDYSTWNSGKGCDLWEQAKFDRVHFIQVFKDFAMPFLSSAEIEKICSGQDLYLTAEQALTRYERLNQKLKEQTKRKKKS